MGLPHRRVQGGRGARRLSKRTWVIPHVHMDLTFQEETIYIGLSQATGERYFWWVKAGELCLCSQGLLLPLGVPPTPAPAYLTFSLSHEKEVWRVPTTTSDVGNVTRRQGPSGSISPAVTAFSGIVPFWRKRHADLGLWSVGRAVRSLVWKGPNPRNLGNPARFTVCVWEGGGGGGYHLSYRLHVDVVGRVVLFAVNASTKRVVQSSNFLL